MSVELFHARGVKRLSLSVVISITMSKLKL